MSDELVVQLAESTSKNELLQTELAKCRENNLALYRASADAQALQDAYENGLYVGSDALERSQAETKAARARVATLEMRIQAAQEALLPLGGEVVNRMPPTHPGEVFLYEWSIAQSGSELSTWSEQLQWSYEKMRSFVNEEIRLDDVMAAELSAVTGTTKAFWIALQKGFDDSKSAMSNELTNLLDDDDEDVTKNEICTWYARVEKQILRLVPVGTQTTADAIVRQYVGDDTGYGTSHAKAVILGLHAEGRISLSDEGAVVRLK